MYILSLLPFISHSSLSLSSLELQTKPSPLQPSRRRCHPTTIALTLHPVLIVVIAVQPLPLPLASPSLFLFLTVAHLLTDCHSLSPPPYTSPPVVAIPLTSCPSSSKLR
ncbi:hypothetical protein Scep_027980 [Stephania cephalantha]|uniref:Uncharacterized protein n=1 Tax=Stephania cephalantha TaxID=152367 RepID=A0AAP0EGF2_9MAGN